MSSEPRTPLPEADDPTEPALFTYSVVVPVFNSVGVVGTTIDRIIEVFEEAGLRYQLVLVNDGSRDGSWDVIAARARTSQHVVALNLLRNYGQHHANLAGMRESTGDYVITMDDDLQNPPDQALLLIEEAMHGHDVVFGRFEQKQAPGYRRLGSRMISLVNRRVFGQPPGLAVSNFRILRRDVVERICESRTAHPYITGQALMYSNNVADVLVRHDPRPVGRATTACAASCRWCSRSCSATRCSRCGPRPPSASSWRSAASCSAPSTSSAASSCSPTWRGGRRSRSCSPCFNGVVIMLLSMLGEYVVRTLNAVSAVNTYHVTERVSS